MGNAARRDPGPDSHSQACRTFLWNAYSQGCSSTECCSMPIFAMQLQGNVNLWQRLHSTTCLMSLQRRKCIFLLPTQTWVYWLYRVPLSSRVLQQQIFLIAAEKPIEELIAGTMGSLKGAEKTLRSTQRHMLCVVLLPQIATQSRYGRDMRENESWDRLKKKHLPYTFSAVPPACLPQSSSQTALLLNSKPQRSKALQSVLQTVLSSVCSEVMQRSQQPMLEYSGQKHSYWTPKE